MSVRGLPGRRDRATIPSDAELRAEAVPGRAMTRREQAAMLGVSVTTLSRLLAKERRGEADWGHDEDPLRVQGTVRAAHSGAASELIVAGHLLREGWEVFLNVARCGPIDLIAYKEGTTMFIEVKTARKGQVAFKCAEMITHIAIVKSGTFAVTIRPRERSPDGVTSGHLT